MRCKYRKCKRAGLSLAEVAVSTVLVAVLLVSSLQTTAFVVTHRHLTTDSMRAAMLAEELLAEIMALPYRDQDDESDYLGPDDIESDGDRRNFDDVDDYEGWSASPPTNRLGIELTDFANWQRSATVNWVAISGLGNRYSNTTLKKITITVTRPDGSIYQAIGFKGEPPRTDPRLTGGERLTNLSLQIDSDSLNHTFVSSGFRNEVITSLTIPVATIDNADSDVDTGWDEYQAGYSEGSEWYDSSLDEPDDTWNGYSDGTFESTEDETEFEEYLEEPMDEFTDTNDENEMEDFVEDYVEDFVEDFVEESMDNESTFESEADESWGEYPGE